MVGAPRPAGRIAKLRCGGWASGWPTCPMTVPPVTLEPTFSGFSCIVLESNCTLEESADLNVSYPGTLRPSSWSSWPVTLGWPALRARCGRAKSRWREFSALDGAGFALAGLAAFAEPLPPELSPAVAGDFGAASLGDCSLKSFEERLCCLGTGCVCSIDPRCA